jgi:ribosomal protein L7/L12
MFVPLWLIGLAAALLLLLAVLAFRRPGGPSAGSGQAEMIEQQRRASRPPSPTIDEQALLAGPEIRAAIAAGHKLEAIKLVRENSGLGLKEAKELVERHIQ